jgi:hypothetical protein
VVVVAAQRSGEPVELAIGQQLPVRAVQDPPAAAVQHHPGPSDVPCERSAVAPAPAGRLVVRLGVGGDRQLAQQRLGIYGPTSTQPTGG